MTFPSRDLHGPAQTRGIRDLYQTLFAAELIDPSPTLWLTFAWISDVPILDNSARRFAALEPDWPAGDIRLTQVLESLLLRGAHIKLIIRAHEHNDYVIDRLRRLKGRFWDQLQWVVEEEFHAKGLLGRDFFLSGSMNLTYKGITVNGEHLVLRTDKSIIAEQKLQLELQWDGLNHDR